MYDYVARLDDDYKKIFKDMEYFLQISRAKYIRKLNDDDKENIIKRINEAKEKK